METREDRLLVVAIFLEQTVFLCLSDRDDGAVTRGEHAFRLGVLHHLESLEVGTLAELIVSVAVAVVHDYPRASVDGLANAYAFHCFIRLVHMSINLGPLASVALSSLGSELLGSCLVDASTRFTLIEKVVELVGRIEDDVAVDGGSTIIEEVLWSRCGRRS